MGIHFQKNSEFAANSKHFRSSFWKKLNVFLCNFFAIKWEFDKMGTFFRISCYFGAKWEPILSRAYCSPVHAQVREHCGEGSCSLTCDGTESCSLSTIACPPEQSCEVRCPGQTSCSFLTLEGNISAATGGRGASVAPDQALIKRIVECDNIYTCRNMVLNEFLPWFTI